MTWKHFFPGRCIGYSIFFEHKVQKQAPASLNFLVTPATKRLTVLPFLSLLSMPSSIYFHELTFHPTLLWCDVSTRASTLGRAIEKSRRLNHIFPRPASIYF